MEIRNQRVSRYIMPLREGGSLPALAEADDGFKYVVKLKGAGHGNKALVAELIGGLVAKAFKFKVPEYVLLNLDPLFGITEPDEEVRELLGNSKGINVGIHFLSNAMAFDPAVNSVDPLWASKVVWLDAFLTNVDRSRLNTNMIVRDGEIWLIDHGASLYFHHSWKEPLMAAEDPFPYIKNHVLLPYATRLEEADKLMKQAITPRTLTQIVSLVPEELLEEEGSMLSPKEKRDAYGKFLIERLKSSALFTDMAIKSRQALGL